MVNADSNRWVTVGYARKSPDSTIKVSQRKLLVELMARKLRDKLLCSKVYASYRSRADCPFIDRDSGKMPEMRGVDGDTNDFINFLTKANQNMRIVAIDFAGLSTNLRDIEHLLT
ncbi:hypothetical protein DM01DRAFT_1133978 [Hesseltinella vesiculosa]|uniref:Uncharacterized protein n=1 Tax=Hesseltinella vesiculosa TaxID=101127 RepID=A0A1X2G8Q5_9FUNG|nr:hypothetical protein DM01DRAFT_1133978 [Hesseltinella vesiculosa]